MKKQSIYSALVMLLVLCCGRSLVAQDSIPVKTLPPVTVTSTHTKVPDNVWSSFRSYFSNAIDTKWYELNKNYLVRFMTDDNQNRALFTKKGNLIYHISYGYEKNLPDAIRKQVKSTYFDYDITRAIKVNEGNRIVWVVNLEDAKTLILVRLESGEMDEVERLNKI
jgi:hypothetical protein